MAKVKVGELLTKKIDDLKLDKKDFKEIFDGLIENDAEAVDKEKAHNELKVKLDEAEKKAVKADEYLKTIEDKDKEINDLKIKYIDRFENGDPKGSNKDKDEEGEGTTPESFDDLFENV